MRGQRIEKLLLVEALRDFQIFFLAGHGIQVAQGLRPCRRTRCRARVACARSSRIGYSRAVHPAIFSRHVKRLLIAAVHIHVEIPGHDFVNGVERRPNLLALAQAIKEVDRERAEITTLQRVLTLCQFGTTVLALALSSSSPVLAYIRAQPKDSARRRSGRAVRSPVPPIRPAAGPTRGIPH